MGQKRHGTSQSVELFEELYHYVAAPTEMVGQVLAGHLAIEFLMRRLLSQYDPKLAAHVDDLSHARLVALCHDVGVLSPERAHVLALVNALRNRYAHAIRYDPEVSEITTLFSAAAVAFTDYSEGIKNGLVELRSGGPLCLLNRWLLAELFLAIVYDLHQEFVARGGDEERP
ncbi:hypothetical protein [Paraburkholderia sediminicola]|uniref:hypothetical protein n=1 Tax=Paraburkholderia sediminicola TaxID=458836 RepID=UPI0038BD6F99